MTALLRTALLGSAVLMLSGCPYKSPVPISEPDPALFMSELIGEWRNADLDGRMWIARHDADEYFLIGGYDNDPCKGGTRGHISRVGGALFLNMLHGGFYMLARVELEANRLTLRILSDQLDSVHTGEELSAQLALRLNDPVIYYETQQWGRTARPVTAEGADAAALAAMGCPYDGSVPIGQPRANTIDPRLLGDWLIQMGDTTDLAAPDTSLQITFQAFNDREYLLTFPEEDPSRAYLTRLGDALFINFNSVGGKDVSVGRVIFQGEEVRVHLLNSGMKDATTSGQLRARVAKRVDDPAIYWWEAFRLWRVPKAVAQPLPRDTGSASPPYQATRR